MKYLVFIIFILPAILLSSETKILVDEFPFIQPVSVEKAPQISLNLDDEDNDGIPNSNDKCPHTKKQTLVGKDGCALKSIIVLVQGQKQHTAIVVSTQAGSVTVDKANLYVTLNSKNTPPSQPKTIDPKELHSLFGSLSQNKSNKKIHYTLYFNNLNLTQDSKKELQTLIKQLFQIPNPYILIIGHTDTMGSQQQNYILGLKRAQSIAKSIQDTHIKYLDLKIDSYSENDLAIETEDEVKEQGNRRVEIFIQ